ncbi:methyltransferase domain-containing protein [Candidatus Mycobacterium wuenschmannii]|uniref:Methyltransferase domain-containing protein n=1 Tax=Candidatus Mycobacterium wuenschmannii TaxID=3027808 RepID=A0ABY8W0Q2_9MYCO|nr:methyltransferase domain-containing protein [Candidatus Mycobacterium wuenschmannii]WIM89475.1 methyltransferase domain-containing protein [Candidatus Mycobacterium wuenschmannii]
MTADACEAPAVWSADVIYQSAASGNSCWSRNHLGNRRELPMGRWIGGRAATPQDRLADEHMLRQCSSRPTLDLGCGPGRFAAALQARGLPALGVDSSTAAVEMTRQRGGTAIRRDLFAPLPAEGSWAQVLLTDGNIGIGGDPVQMLRRAAALLAEDGVVVVETDSSASDSCYEWLRWETESYLGHWFPWSRVGAGSLVDIARAAGLRVVSVIDVHDRVIAVLTASPPGTDG